MFRYPAVGSKERKDHAVFPDIVNLPRRFQCCKHSRQVTVNAAGVQKVVYIGKGGRQTPGRLLQLLFHFVTVHLQRVYVIGTTANILGQTFQLSPKGTVFTFRTVFAADTGVDIGQQCGQRITVLKPVQKSKNFVKVVDCLRSVVTDKPVDTQRNGVDSLLQGCIGGNAGGFLRRDFLTLGNQFQVFVQEAKNRRHHLVSNAFRVLRGFNDYNKIIDILLCCHIDTLIKLFAELFGMNPRFPVAAFRDFSRPVGLLLGKREL